MAGPTFITPVDVSTGTTGSYVDIDVSGSVSGDATAAIILIKYGASGSTSGVRKNGSTDDLKGANVGLTQAWTVVGLDGSKIFEMYIDNADIDCYLYGYLETECTMFTNSVDKSTGTTGSYVDVDISADTGGNTAIAAICTILNTADSFASRVVYLRKNGSTDDRGGLSTTVGVLSRNYVIGVDGSELFEQKIADTDQDLYLIGYLTSEITMNTNGTNVSLAATTTWTDLTALPAGAIGGVYEVYNTTTTAYDYGFRKNGDTTSHIGEIQISNRGAFSRANAIVQCDASRLVEGYIENTAVDFYEMGYFTSPAPGGGTKYYIAIG